MPGGGELDSVSVTDGVPGGQDGMATGRMKATGAHLRTPEAIEGKIQLAS